MYLGVKLMVFLCKRCINAGKEHGLQHLVDPAMILKTMSFIYSRMLSQFVPFFNFGTIRTRLMKAKEGIWTPGPGVWGWVKLTRLKEVDGKY